MKIEEALKVNEKVKRPLWLEDEYIMIQDDKFVGSDGLLVGLDPEDAFADDWQPYHGAKEIRPEGAGELWKFNQYTWFTYFGKNEQGERVLMGICDDGDISQVDKNDKIRKSINPFHNKNGWELIYSPDKEVMAKINREDDSVERVEIEGVKWKKVNHGKFGEGVVPEFPSMQEFHRMEGLLGIPMKMILEIPKI